MSLHVVAVCDANCLKWQNAKPDAWVAKPFAWKGTGAKHPNGHGGGITEWVIADNANLTMFGY